MSLQTSCLLLTSVSTLTAVRLLQLGTKRRAWCGRVTLSASAALWSHDTAAATLPSASPAPTKTAAWPKQRSITRPASGSELPIKHTRGPTAASIATLSSATASHLRAGGSRSLSKVRQRHWLDGRGYFSSPLTPLPTQLLVTQFMVLWCEYVCALCAEEVCVCFVLVLISHKVTSMTTGLFFHM